MDYKLVVDSCCELVPSLRESLSAESIPLTLLLGDEVFVDDENLDVDDFLKKMKAYKGQPKSACPSPMDFADKCIDTGYNFIVTLSSKLSGSYASAKIGMDILEEQGKYGYVFDSKSASAGELLVSLKIKELIELGLEKLQIISKVEDFIKDMKTFFVLESLDNLVKNGRMSNIAGLIASFLHIHPILGADKDGNIAFYSKAAGKKKAIERLAEMIGENCKDTVNKILTITHCNNEEQANTLKSLAELKYSFKDILVVPTRGLSSMYANEGGIIIAF